MNSHPKHNFLYALMCYLMVHVIADYVGNTYKLRADSHTKAIEWCRSLDMASRVSFTDQVSVCI